MMIDGQTWAEWATDLFEFEYCAECGGDVDAHVPLVIMGHWFAQCTAVPCSECGRMDLPLHVTGRCPECEPMWAVVASHEGHYDYVLADGLIEVEAREVAEHEGEPFHAVPMTEVYDR